MTESSGLTVDDLVEAYFHAAQYAEAAPELRDYATQRLAVMEDLFDFHLAAEEGGRRAGARDRAAVASLAHQAIAKAATLYGPFAMYLEGGPGPLELQLLTDFRRPVDEQITMLKATYRALVLRAFLLLRPELRTTRAPIEALYERGLPRVAPDPDDFF